MPSKSHPNMVVLLTDQQRFDTLGCSGNPICRTPVLDRIAEEGMIFRNAYTANALCTPARASLMTGLYPHNHGQLSNMGNFNGVFDDQVLDKIAFPQLLDQAGYTLGYAGKWHLPKEGDTEFWTFSEWYDTRAYRQYLKDRAIAFEFGASEVQPLEWGEEAPFFGPSVLSPEDHHDGWVASRSCDMIDAFAEKDDPFFVCAAFHGPHFPYAVPEPYNTLYNPDDVPRWNNFDETFENKPSVQQKEALRWNTSHLTWPDWQKVIATYWGYCTYIDTQIGRIVDRLKEQGVYDNTLIVFLSDHGDMLGCHRLPFKGWNMYEEANRIPLIVRAPGLAEAGAKSTDFVSLVDVMPTLLDLAGVSVPQNLDGRSLRPLLEQDPGAGWRKEAYVEFNGYESSLATIRMVRTDKWKYVYNPFSEDELYDLESDPGELNNLAGRIAFGHELRRMKTRMATWLRETETRSLTSEPGRAIHTAC